jgi:hypothetical protein
MAAKKARKSKRRRDRERAKKAKGGAALTTAVAGEAPGGRRTERTAVWENVGEGKIRAQEVERVVDPIDLMYRAHQLDVSQYRAAQSYRQQAETLFSGYRCALDPTPGGGGGDASPTVAQVEAASRLHQANMALGVIDGTIVALVAGEGLTLEQAAREFFGIPDPARAQVRELGTRLRGALHVLADVWRVGTAPGWLRVDRRFEPKALERPAERISEVMRGAWHATRWND